MRMFVLHEACHDERLSSRRTSPPATNATLCIRRANMRDSNQAFAQIAQRCVLQEKQRGDCAIRACVNDEPWGCQRERCVCSASKTMPELLRRRMTLSNRNISDCISTRFVFGRVFRQNDWSRVCVMAHGDARDDTRAALTGRRGLGGTAFTSGSRQTNKIAFLRATLVRGAAELIVRRAVRDGGARAIRTRLRTTFRAARAWGSASFA